MTTGEPPRRPMYARVLRLRQLHPSGVLCFLLFEGMIALAVLLALAELVSWWGVLVLPVAVAAMVKLNDVIAGALAAGQRGAAPPSRADTGLAATDATPRDAVGADGAAIRPEEREPVAPHLEPLATPDPAVRQVSRDLTDSMDPVDSPQQRLRQSARRRYRDPGPTPPL